MPSRDDGRWGEKLSDLLMRFETQFQATFRSDELIWLNPEKTARYTTEGLATHLIELFADYMETEIATDS
jgi:hypothetical protein